MQLAMLRDAGRIDTWSARAIDADWQPNGPPDPRIQRASCILFLVSSSFISSRYLWSPEAEIALERQRTGEASVLPVLLRPCQWQSTPVADLAPLPRDRRPITLWESAADALADINQGLRRHLEGRRLDSTLEPSYGNDDARRLGQDLETVHGLRDKALAAGSDTAALDATISTIQQQLRIGGEVQAGDILGGRFRLLEAFADDDLGRTWRGYDRLRQQRVLVKTLHHRFRRDLYRQEVFFRSPQQMVRLASVDGVVNVIEAHGKDDEVHFYVQEYMAGGDFKQKIHDGELTLNERLEVILDIGETLHEAHRLGVIHRDVKPADILFDLDGNAKISGFDRLHQADPGGARRPSQDTFLHVAPEAMVHGDAGPPADVYGLGMTTLEALHGDDLPQGFAQSLQQLMAGLNAPAACLPVIEKALAWKADDRWPTLRDYCGALHQAFIPVHGEPAPEAPAEEENSGKTRTKTQSFVIPKGPQGKPEGIAFGARPSRAPHRAGQGVPLAPLLLLLAGAAVLVLLLLPNGETDDTIVTNLEAAPTEAPPPPRDCARLARSKGIDLQFVPGGSYIQGTDDNLAVYGNHPTAPLRSQPEHTVQLSPFWIGTYAITNEQYDRFVRETDYQSAKFRDDAAFNAPRQPVVGVSWHDASQFAEWASMELPTEAQWEAAARSADGFTYPWGNDPPTPRHANYGNEQLATVDAHPDGGGPFGTVGQAGGVWEWCRDTWNERAYSDRDGSVDPVSQYGSASRRVARGGSWVNDADNLVAAVRIQFGALNKHRNNVGFRVVCTPSP